MSRNNLHNLLASVPNLITVARLLAVPLMVWLILTDELRWAFWLFVAAGISDGVDGFIAKRFKVESVGGSYLDPIADKVMLVCVYVTLGMQDHIDLWLVILIVFRDALIVGGALLSQLLERPVRMKPLFISKVNTVAQIVLAAVVLAELGLQVGTMPLEMLIEIVVAATTVASGAVYLVQWISGTGSFFETPAPKDEAVPGASSSDDADSKDAHRRSA